MSVSLEESPPLPRKRQRLAEGGEDVKTAHKAKGQEWDEVTLGDDFPEMMLGTVPRTAANAKAFKEKGLSVEEVNLAYVAATRAKKELRESDSMADFLRWAGVNSADA